jgi:hypothetical protein
MDEGEMTDPMGSTSKRKLVLGGLSTERAHYGGNNTFNISMSSKNIKSLVKGGKSSRTYFGSGAISDKEESGATSGNAGVGERRKLLKRDKRNYTALVANKK